MVIDGSTPMAYNYGMIFVETSLFTRRIVQVMDDDAYGELQGYAAFDLVLFSFLGIVQIAVDPFGKTVGVAAVEYGLVFNKLIRNRLLFGSGLGCVNGN